MNGRRLCLRADVPESPRPWLIRLPDGQIRGPLSLEQLASLAEVGVVVETTEIASVGGDDWRAVKTLPIWSELRPKRKPIALRPATNCAISATAASPESPPAAGDSADAGRAMARTRDCRERETRRLLKGMYMRDVGRLLEVLGFAAAVAGCVCVGDMILYGLRPLWGSAFMLLAILGLTRLMAFWFVWRIVK